MTVRKTPMPKTKLQKLFMLLTIAIIAGIGGYLVYFSSASEPLVNRCNSGATSDVVINHTPFWPNASSVPGGWVRGATVTHATTAQLYNQSSQYCQLIIDFRFNPLKEELLSVECKHTDGCYRSNSAVLGTVGTRHPTGFSVCINLPPNTYTEHRSSLVNAYFKLLSDYDGSPYSDSNLWHGIAEGSCAQNPSASGVISDGGRGYGCGENWASEFGGYSGTAPCGPNQSIGNVPFNGFSALPSPSTTGQQSQSSTRSEGTSPSPAKTRQQASGSSGGGSSATRVGQSPSSTPTTSSQGEEAEDQKLEPNAFYDGKQYDKGSEDDGFSGVIGNVQQRLGRNWLVIIAAILVGSGIGGAAYWYMRRRV